jgi:hypothetical protein
MKIEIMAVDYLGLDANDPREVVDGLVVRDKKTKEILVQDVDSVLAIHLRCKSSA